MHVAALTHGANKAEYIANTEYLENRFLYRELSKHYARRAPFVIPAWIASAYANFDEPRARRKQQVPAVSKFSTSYLRQGKDADLDGEADRKRLGLKPHQDI